jgi:hypothetical protein
VIEHPNAARCDSADRQFLIAGHPQLTNQKDIQFEVQSACNFEAHRNSSARKS